MGVRIDAKGRIRVVRVAKRIYPSGREARRGGEVDDGRKEQSHSLRLVRMDFSISRNKRIEVSNKFSGRIEAFGVATSERTDGICEKTSDRSYVLDILLSEHLEQNSGCR